MDPKDVKIQELEEERKRTALLLEEERERTALLLEELRKERACAEAANRRAEEAEQNTQRMYNLFATEKRTMQTCIPGKMYSNFVHIYHNVMLKLKIFLDRNSIQLFEQSRNGIRRRTPPPDYRGLSE